VLNAVQTEGFGLSEDISRLPPQVQERLLRLQQLQQTLQSVMAQKQQVDMEQTEVEQTLSELQKTADEAVIYKAIGSLLVKSEKAKVTTDLVERKELLTTRSTVLSRQEERLRSQVKEVQTKLQEDLSPVSPASP
jgi:prefoldin beta subunit